jgi:DNA repair exonuclease SbcCD nuclease subunit
MKIIHTADNHLDMPLSSLPPEKAAIRRESRLKSFSQIIDFAIAEKADVLLISGDLFHTSAPPKSVVSFCCGEFERLCSVPVFIALGNHDYGFDFSCFPKNVRVFPTEFTTFDMGDYTVSGASFFKEECSIPIFPQKNCEKVNILCLHGDLSPSSAYNPLDKDYLENLGYDYVALGHVHIYNRYKHILFPGCHDGGGFDETGEKGFLSCDISKNNLNVSFVPSSSMIYEKLSCDISNYTSSAQIVSALSNSLNGGIYEVSLTGVKREGFTPNISFIESSLSPFTFFIKVKDESSSAVSLDDNPLFKLVSEFIYKNLDKKDAALALEYAEKALLGEEIEL